MALRKNSIKKILHELYKTAKLIFEDRVIKGIFNIGTTYSTYNTMITLRINDD